MPRRPFLALLALIATMTAHAQSPIPAPPTVPTNGYILIDHDSGRVLAEQRSTERMEPASITKLMTGYIAFHALKEKRLKLTDTVVISEYAWRTGGAASGGSTTFLDLGSQVPVEVLIKGMIIQSGNDATIAMAEKLGGTESGFVEMMNTYAKRLGLTGTHFENSWGGPSARSTIRLRAISPRWPRRSSANIRTTTAGIPSASSPGTRPAQTNRNGLLYRDSSVDGIKTGHTESAKYCLVSSAKRDGMRLISVVLGSPTQKAREDASSALLNYGFTFYETVSLQQAGKALLTPRVYKGDVETVAWAARATSA